MPIYTYHCKDCDRIETGYRKIDDRHDGPTCRCGRKMELRITATMIQADLAPYRAIAIDKETGKRPVIQSRRQHREFLKRNDYVEVGNEFKEPKLDEGPANAPVFDTEQMKKQGWIEENL